MTGWVGWIWFAGIVMIVVGVFNLISGLYAILNDDLFVQVRNRLLVFDLTGWGWIHLIFGIVLVIVGTAVTIGQEWARVVAIILVAINAVTQMAWIAANPWWSLIVIAIDVIVLYALIVHGRETAALRP
ncbi:membrane protein [Streptosporangium carneum]